MLSEESLQEYKRMSTGDRARLTFQMIEDELPFLLSGTAEQVDRKFELLRRENDRRNARICAGLARTRDDVRVADESATPQ